MKNFFLMFGLVLALVFFAGCKSTPVVDRGVLAPEGTDETELCTVKIHYIIYVSGIDNQRVEFDNVYPQYWNGMAYQTVKIPAGKHSFYARMNSSGTTGTMRLDAELEAGKHYFLDVHVNGVKQTIQLFMLDEDTGKEL